MILHMCPRADWESARAEYRAASLRTDGFVHCSDPGVVHLPAQRLYPGRRDLVLLELDTARLDVPVRWEPGSPPDPAGIWFPHVFGPIPVRAVVAVHDFPPSEDGSFRLPATLAQR